MDMMNRNELKYELLQNVTGGDQKHYDELCEKAEAFVKVCVENGLSKAYYQCEMKKIMDDYIGKGMLAGNEPGNLWRIVEYYSHKLR